jgi:hypothetical protein
LATALAAYAIEKLEQRNYSSLPCHVIPPYGFLAAEMTIRGWKYNHGESKWEWKPAAPQAQ